MAYQKVCLCVYLLFTYFVNEYWYYVSLTNLNREGAASSVPLIYKEDFQRPPTPTTREDARIKLGGTPCHYTISAPLFTFHLSV